MKVEFGLLQTENKEERRVCCEENCFRYINIGQECYIDTNTNQIFCDQCGMCERYQRKKQVQRAEAGVVETPLIKGLDY